MYIVCSDLESTLIPEIWIHIAEKTNIQELRLTTRDISDYDILMKKRLKILKTHNVKLKDIQRIIGEIEPLKGAINFLNWLKKRSQIIILSDTFLEFVNVLIDKLFYSTIFCNFLEIDNKGFIKDYQLRQKDGKRKVIKSLKLLGFKVIAIGDSYNDINMLKEADVGILFKPPESIKKEFFQFLTVQNYKELKLELSKYI